MTILSATKMSSQQFILMGEDPPGVRLELVNGEIILSPSPNPNHSDITLALAAILRPYILKNRLGRLLADVDTVFTPDTTRRPDLLFISRRREHIIQKVIHGPPDLCIEIISPSSATTDRVDKFELYRAAGVKNYWIIDPHARMAEAFVLKNNEYSLAASGRDNAVVKFPPFPQLAIKLADIWPAK